MKFLKLKKDQFLYLVMLSFVFISSSTLVITKDQFEVKDKIKKVLASNEKNYYPLPVLLEESNYPITSAQAVIAIDLLSGISLYEKNAETPLLPASTTKIVTALVSLDAYPLDSVLTVKNTRVEGQKLGLYQGEQIRVIDLLYAMLVYSANDAAEVLAQNYVGGREAFIEAMNFKAQELSMTNSKFINPTGLDGNITTARDLLRVSEVAMRNEVFANIVSTKEIVISDVTKKSVYRIKNINELLGKVPGVLGVKTGWTESARENLVTYVERDGHKVAIVVLGSQDRFGETEELIDWIFKSYKWESVRPE